MDEKKLYYWDGSVMIGRFELHFIKGIYSYTKKEIDEFRKGKKIYVVDLIKQCNAIMYNNDINFREMDICDKCFDILKKYECLEIDDVMSYFRDQNQNQNHNF